MANQIVTLKDDNNNPTFPIAGGMAEDSITTQMLKDGSVTSDKIDSATINLLQYKTSLVTIPGARAILTVKGGIGLITTAGFQMNASGVAFDNIPVTVPFTQEIALCTGVANQNVRCVIENGTTAGTSKISIAAGITYPANFYLKGAVVVDSY